MGPADPSAQAPICVLLLPVPLERFAERERTEELLRRQGVVGVDPARLPYTAFGRLPEPLADGLAARQARRLVRTLRRRTTRRRPASAAGGSTSARPTAPCGSPISCRTATRSATA